jgi:hypothetical protein
MIKLVKKFEAYHIRMHWPKINDQKDLKAFILFKIFNTQNIL